MPPGPERDVGNHRPHRDDLDARASRGGGSRGGLYARINGHAIAHRFSHAVLLIEIAGEGSRIKPTPFALQFRFDGDGQLIGAPLHAA